jgi:hypothetical protein
MGQPGGYPPIPAFTNEGDLPRGRFCASFDDVEKWYVTDEAYEGSSTRKQVWSDFATLLDLIKRLRVRVPAVFLGGSFVTSKLDPPDIDVALLVDMSRISSAATFGKVEKIVATTKSDLSLEVDSFLIRWHPDGSQVGGDPRYLAQRGSWDDFWQRKVPMPDRIPPQRAHAMPVRGYLEVMIDGYS